jgi:hypothetical protein
MFSNQHIWPRGFPLDKITEQDTYTPNDGHEQWFDAPIQQGLADESPDVDAVWRLVFNHPFRFEQSASVWLPRDTWCPFNSQTTWWWPPAYPLLYLPSYCSFRMTDIWRSFVAQRCLWEMGYGVVFHAPEVCQQRNEHTLIRDFEDEIPGYLTNQRIVSALSALNLADGEMAVFGNLVACYEELVRIGAIPQHELALVRAWIHDLEFIEYGVLKKEFKQVTNAIAATALPMVGK